MLIRSYIKIIAAFVLIFLVGVCVVMMGLMLTWMVDEYNERTKPKLKPEKVFTCIQVPPLRTLHEDSTYRLYSDNIEMPKEEILKVWNSKPRKTDTYLMLAKAFIESSFRPNIFRYEKHLKAYPIYRALDSINPLRITDCGLFQVMGFTIPELNQEHDFTVERQMDVFDSMMTACMLKAKGDIRQAVHYYNFPCLPYYPNFNSEYTIYHINRLKNENQRNQTQTRKDPKKQNQPPKS